jgi:hypothetical protein
LLCSPQVPKVFQDESLNPDIPRYHVLVHNEADGNNEQATAIFKQMVQAWGAAQCHLLRINSSPTASSGAPDLWTPLILRTQAVGSNTGSVSSIATVSNVSVAGASISVSSLGGSQADLTAGPLGPLSSAASDDADNFVDTEEPQSAPKGQRLTPDDMSR